MEQLKKPLGAFAEANSRALKIGVVPYLNVQPLIWAFQNGHGNLDGAKHEITPAAPRALAGMLREGQFDAALVPVFEFFLNPVYTIIPDIAIATHGRVGSVVLFSMDPLEQVSTVRLDTSSLTSANLIKVLLAERGMHVRFEDASPPPLNGSIQLPEATAQLLIGDPAIAQMNRHPYSYDLGEMWFELTGLPFVFAAWLVHPWRRAFAMNSNFLAAKETGLQNLEAIAGECAKEFGTTPEFALHYFQRNLSYDLSREHIDGCREFGRLCAKHGLIPEVPSELNFHAF